MPKHSSFGHGFIQLTFADAGAAQAAQLTLREYSHTTSSPPSKQLATRDVKIISVDLMEDPSAPLEALIRPEGNTLIVDIETSLAFKSKVAHDRVHELSEEIWRLAQAPGAAKHLCCISDM